MREIKFRQWDSGRKVMYNDIGAVDQGWNGCTILKFDENPLMQFTGLKDKNGKDIYEGDIISLWFEELFFQGTVTGTVKYDESSAYFQIEFKTGTIALIAIDIEYSEIVVIGNIYENGELLEAS
jgi:uncharacterized phage protein (TIGR01671 family)